ncbi:MAG: LuxR C-terminal-related transcriptional regulator [Mycobacterium sp.]
MGDIDAALSDPDVSGVAVWGSAGAGKSRIAREAMQRAAARGSDTRWVVGTSAGRSIPLGAFTAWTQPGVTDTVQLVRRVIESLTAAGPATVIVVDDAHRLDDLSAFVVNQIVQRRTAQVILTLPDGEPIPPAVQEITEAGRFTRVDLPTLSPAETEMLLSAALDSAIDPDAAQRLWNLTHGNVLYLRNIVEQEISDGRLVRQRGFVRWLGDPVLPRGLVALIESRMGGLPDPVSDVVDTLAVGEPIDLAALQRITDPAAIEEADTRGLIVLDSLAGGVQVRLAHPLFGQIRRKRAPATKLRRLRGLVAAELAGSDDIRIVVRRATLTLEADDAPDADLLLRAAHGAVWLADLPLANRLAEAATRAGAGPEPNFVRAHALSWLGRGEEAESVLAGIPTDGLTDGECARLAFLRASNLLWAIGDPARAKAVIDDAARVAPPGARTYIDAFYTVYWFATDRPDLAAEAAEPLVLHDLPPVVGAEIGWVLTAIAADAGRTSVAVEYAKAGYDAATRSLDAPHMRFNIADAHVGALLVAGSIPDALEVADWVRGQAADLPGAAQSLGAGIAGRAALGAGRLDDARVLLERASTGLTAAGYGAGWGFRYRVPNVMALAISDSTGPAVEALAELDRVRRTFRSLDHEQSLARAWVSAAQGAVSEAIAIVRSAAERASSKGQFAVEVMCLQTAAQFGDPTCAPRLRELESVVEGPRVGLAARFARALRDGDAAEMSSLSEEFESMGDVVAATDAAAHAAVRYRAQELRGSSLTCSARASALAEQCGGLTTPVLYRAVESLPFTDREREIVSLLAAGLSNREVAERLTLSVRTVESHIYRAMNKTGTGSREELVKLLSGGST